MDQKIDVINHKETGALRIEAGRSMYFHARAGKKGDAPAKTPLQPIVLAWVEKNGQGNEGRYSDQKMQPAQSPQDGAAQEGPSLLHI